MILEGNLLTVELLSLIDLQMCGNRKIIKMQWPRSSSEKGTHAVEKVHLQGQSMKHGDK